MRNEESLCAGYSSIPFNLQISGTKFETPGTALRRSAMLSDLRIQVEFLHLSSKLAFVNTIPYYHLASDL
jgi:hypothetical protein